MHPSAEGAPCAGHRRRRALRRAAALLAVLAAASGCAHMVRPPGGAPYDFARPPTCPTRYGTPPPPPAGRDVVHTRYLGAGGVAIGWRGHWVMTAPFFTNPGIPRLLTFLSTDEEAVEAGLAGVPLGDVKAILAGHSHYDHLADLPHVARLADRATLYVNRSGARALRAPGGVAAHRLVTLEDKADGWIDLVAADGERLPMRLLTLPTEHAPHAGPISFFTGEIEDDWQRPWRRHLYAQLRVGQPYAFVLELLDDAGAVRSRLFLQDSAGARGLDRLPPGPYDLAVLCMASAQTVKPYPKNVLALLRPRHALVTHYESFFRHPSRPIRFVPLLYRWRAERFLRWTGEALADVEPSPPIHESCGPGGEGWTMPLPGEWLLWDAGAAEGGSVSRE